MAHLSRHGIAAQALSSQAARGTLGQALRDTIGGFNADMVVMGAFGQSRWRKKILGGVTRTMLGNMTVPILMSR